MNEKQFFWLTISLFSITATLVGASIKLGEINVTLQSCHIERPVSP